MAVSVIGGLLLSTLLTLIFIPVVYELMDRKVFAADRQKEQRPRDLQSRLAGDLTPATGK